MKLLFPDDSGRKRLIHVRAPWSAALLFTLVSLLAALTFQSASAQKAGKEKKTFPKGANVIVGSFSRPPGHAAPRDWSEWETRIQDTMLEKLGDAGISVLERARLNELKDELKRGGVDVDADTAQQIGKLSGATYMIVGHTSYDVNNAIVANEYVLKLKVRLVSLRTGNVLKNYTAEAKKKGKFGNKEGEEDHFLESDIDQACADLAKKIAADPPDPEEAPTQVGGAGEGGRPAVGILEEEGDGQATVIGGDEAAAHAAARDAALRSVVMRMTKLFTRGDNQQSAETIIGEDPSRYAEISGAAISDTIRDGVCHVTYNVHLFLNSAPEGKLALIPRLRTRGLLRLPKVMVIVPESHIQRRLPDPAVETEIIRQVREAGFNVVDAKQSAAIRDQDWAKAVEAGGNVTQEELSRLKNEYDADILITGEAFSERAESDRTGSGTVLCAARAEIKAFRTDNAEFLFSDAKTAQATGIGEATTAKSALQNAGKNIGPEIVTKLFKDGFGKTTIAPGGGTEQVAGTAFNIKLSGLQASDIKPLLKAFMKVNGVIKISDHSFEAGILTLKLLVTQEAADTFGTDFPDDPALKTFHLTTTTSHGTTAEAKVKK